MKIVSILCTLAVIAAIAIGHLPVAAQSPGNGPLATTFPFPADRMQTMLIRNTLTAANHGMITGNFTVLRDLATEDFRQGNQAGDLAARIAPLRQQKIDLSPTLITEPQLARAATESPSGELQLVGFFPTRPRQIEFALTFRRANGGWMIQEISINAISMGQ